MLKKHYTVKLGELKKIPAIMAGNIELEVILSQNSRNFFFGENICMAAVNRGKNKL
jgi:hypothetical protein